MTNFALTTDNLPKDASGARMMAPIDEVNADLRFAYLIGYDSYTRSDDNQDVTVSHIGVFPVDNWSMVDAGNLTVADDLVHDIVNGDLSAYPDNAVGIIRLNMLTNTGRVLPTGATYDGMYMGTGDTFEMKMKMSDIAELQAKNAVAAANIVLEYAVFAMPITTS